MKCVVLLTLFCGIALGDTRVEPLVSTKVGRIRGLRDERGYNKFLGVPYGKVGKNIFGTAEPHPHFDDIFEANDDSKICVQTDRRNSGAIGTTDCLNMNIYVPDNATTSHRLPVMVWIHGGAFIGGGEKDADHSPLALLRHDVIVITVRYRLGVFGFMCLDIPEVPGNTGLKDQVLALRWIKENIEAFGGDANEITAFGVSAGGMSVNLHLFSKYEKLFNKAIIQSGPTNSYWTIVESDTTIPFRLAAELGFNATNIHDALAFLMDKNVHTIAQIAHNLNIANAGGTNQPLTKPCIEKVFEGIENFLIDHPNNMLARKVKKIPVIIGHSNHELAFQYVNADADFFATYDLRKLFALGFDMNKDLSEGLDAVKHYYTGDAVFSENLKWDLINFASDFLFNYPTQRMAQMLISSRAKAVYRYVFSYSGSRNKTWSGATHGDDASYVFNSKLGGGALPAADQFMVDRMTTLWTNFAKYGDPTPTTSELLPVKWTPMKFTKHYYLSIDSDMSVETRPFHDRMAFWDLFYRQYWFSQKWARPARREDFAHFNHVKMVLPRIVH